MLLWHLLYPLEITSCYEYLKLRFRSHNVKLLASTVQIVRQIFHTGCVLFGCSTALEAVIVATFYTTFGGMRGVIWTDVVQALIIVAGLLAVIILGTGQVGGITEVFNINRNDNHVNMERFIKFKRRTDFWSATIGMLFCWIGEYGISQPLMQRYNSLTSLNKAKIAVLFNIPEWILFCTFSSLTRFVAYAYYAKKGCDHC